MNKKVHTPVITMDLFSTIIDAAGVKRKMKQLTEFLYGL